MKINNNPTHTAWIVLIMALISSGCASYAAKEFSCSGLPGDTTCVSTMEAYDAISGGEEAVHKLRYENMLAREEGYDKDDIHKMAQSVDAASPSVTDPLVDSFVTPQLPDGPVPIRTPARVMRIWISPWEDAKTGALIAPGYVYTEIQPRRWVIGRPDSAARQQNRLYTPLEQPSGNSVISAQ